MLFSSGEGETFVDEGTEWVLFLDSEAWVGRVTEFDIELLFTSRELREVPVELDLSIDELLVSFNGLGPPDVSGGRSITPSSDIAGVPLSNGLAFVVRGPGVDEREDGDLRVGRDCVVNESLGGNGGGPTSSSSRVEGSRILTDEPVLRVLLRTEDCLVQTLSVDTVLCVLERGESPAPDCDLKEAKDDVREMAIDESRRVSGEGESSSSLYARRYEH